MQTEQQGTSMRYASETVKSCGWLAPQNRSDGRSPRHGLLSSEIATIVGEDAHQIRERIRAGSLPGVRLHDDFNLVIAYAMTFSMVANHFPLTPDQTVLLNSYRFRSVAGEYKHRATHSNDLMSQIPLRTEFSSLHELKSENPQTFLAEADESHWHD